MSKWFYFHIFVLMYSSIMEFLFVVMLMAGMITNKLNEIVVSGLAIGMGLGVFIIILSILALKKMIIKVTIIETDLNKEKETKL